MATVVREERDVRFGNIGRGVEQFLTRFSDARVDTLQQELMDKISKAPDEAAAAALMGDKRYQSVVTDNTRLSAITSFLNTAPLGKSSIAGYDADGNQKILTFSERETPQEALDRAGLTSERTRMFFAVDPDAEFDLGTPLGRHLNRTAAAESFGGITDNTIVMDQEEFARSMQIKAAEIAIGQRQKTIDLNREEFEFKKGQPLTPFDSLIRAFNEGNLSPNQFEQAWEKLIFKGFGRTELDEKQETREFVNLRGIAIAELSASMVDLMNKVRDDPALISLSGSIARGAANVAAELNAIGSILQRANVESGYAFKADTKFNYQGFAAQSTAFKSLLQDMAVTYAAARGQSNRALSDKDFDRFLDIVGAGTTNPEAFIANGIALLNNLQRNFGIMHRGLQGGEWEDTHEPFATFETDTEAVKLGKWRTLGEEIPGIVLPPEIQVLLEGS